VIVVAYGNEEHLSACLETLGCDVPVVVVDNGRSDLARHICSVFGADYLESAANLGFAAAVNLAIKERRSIGTDVLLLNPDARLDHSHLNILLHHLHRSHDIAAVGPRLRSPGGDTQKTLWPIPSPWLALATMVGVGDRLSRRRFVNGAVLLLRGAAVDAIGGFDERFFLYSEEADWQLRAIRAGWKVAAALDSNAIHVGGGTSSNPTRREILFNASAERFIRKWYGPLGWHIFRIASIITASRRLLISRNPKMKPTYRRAILQFWRGPVRYLASQQGSE
jgi:GT2 family glycosyltransferase